MCRMRRSRGFHSDFIQAIAERSRRYSRSTFRRHAHPTLLTQPSQGIFPTEFQIKDFSSSFARCRDFACSIYENAFSASQISS